MRILVTTNAAVGHFFPLAPTIRALAAAGHDVRVGCPAGFAPTVEAAGFEPLGCVEEHVDASVPPPPPREERAARLTWAVTLSWPSDARTWVDALLEQAAAWRPELVVVEPVEHAGRVVAAALGVPLVEHGWGFTLPHGTTDRGTQGLLDVYSSVGAEPVTATLAVDLGSASVQAGDAGSPVRYRYQPWSQPGEALPPADGRQRVLVTLGTYDNPEAAARIRTVVGAAADCGAQVVAVLGNRDRQSGEPFPEGTTALGWVDLPSAVATCDLVVHHGGAGSSWATLAAGRPAVVTPQMGDQFRNAGLLTAAGSAVTVDPDDLGAPGLRRAIQAALANPRLAERAREVAAENDALPSPGQLAADLASLG